MAFKFAFKFNLRCYTKERRQGLASLCAKILEGEAAIARLVEDVRLGTEDADAMRFTPGPMFNAMIHGVYERMKREWGGKFEMHFAATDADTAIAAYTAVRWRAGAYTRPLFGLM
jgi:hypothetical protein